MQLTKVAIQYDIFYCNLVIKKVVSLGLSNFVVLMFELKNLKISVHNKLFICLYN